MAGADGVVACGLEQLDFALFGTVDGGGAEGTIVVMEAATAEEGFLPVEEEAVGGGEGEGADAEGGGEAIY